MDVIEMANLEDVRNQLEEILKPFQQEQARRQKKSEFVKKCIQSIEKGDFFELDELLKNKYAQDLLEDENFVQCKSIFPYLKSYADEQIENYQLQFKEGLIEAAEKAGIPIKVEYPLFSSLNGIEGKVDFASRTTVINQTTIKTVDPKRIIAAALKIKQKLYDSPFDPQKFIDSLFACYQETLNKSGQAIGNAASIQPLYTDFVLSLQSKVFFQNMDKGKFKGYSIEQFAVDFWRFFSSDVTSTTEGYLVKLASGRGKSLWLIDQNGEKRQITNLSFVKN